MRRDENNLCMLYLFLRYFMNLPHGSLLSARFSEDIFNHWYWYYYYPGSIRNCFFPSCKKQQQQHV